MVLSIKMHPNQALCAEWRQHVLRDRQYAETVADRLIEALFDIDSYRGTGRIYLP